MGFLQVSQWSKEGLKSHFHSDEQLLTTSLRLLDVKHVQPTTVDSTAVLFGGKYFVTIGIGL